MTYLILLVPLLVSKLTLTHFFQVQYGKPHNGTHIIKFQNATRNNSFGRMAHVGMHGLIIKLFDKFCRVIIIVMAIFNSEFGLFFIWT